MAFVICRPQNAVSACRLGYPVYNHMLHRHEGPVINWGRSDVETSMPILNNVQAIRQTIDKPGFLRTMSGRVGINVPTVLVERQLLPIGKWVIRPNEHAEGNDFTLHEVVRGAAPYMIASGHHATQFIEPTREYRVWFFHDNYLTARRVPIRSQNQTEDDPCRSKFGYQWTESYDGATNMIAKIREVINIDFGAVDMLWQPTQRKWYVLEVNSAPSLDHSEVRSFFVEHITHWVDTMSAQQVRPVAPIETGQRRIQVVTPQGLRWLSGTFSVSE